MAKPFKKGAEKGSSSLHKPIKAGGQRDYRPWIKKKPTLATTDWMKKIRSLETAEEYEALHTQFINEINGKKGGTPMPENTLFKLMAAFEAKEKLLDSRHYQPKEKSVKKY